MNIFRMGRHTIYNQPTLLGVPYLLFCHTGTSMFQNRVLFYNNSCFLWSVSSIVHSWGLVCSIFCLQKFHVNMNRVCVKILCDPGEMIGNALEQSTSGNLSLFTSIKRQCRRCILNFSIHIKLDENQYVFLLILFNSCCERYGWFYKK